MLQIIEILVVWGIYKGERMDSKHLYWVCEHCGKPVPYPYYFCNECTEKLLGEPPKPIDPPESEVKNETDN